MSRPQIGRDRLPLDYLRFEFSLKPLHPLGGKLDPAVDILDHLLRIDRHDVLLRAAGLVSKRVLLTEAVEVEIFPLGECEGEPSSTLAAGEESLQVVLVGALARPCDVPLTQDLLHLLEERRRDERLVLTLVVDPSPLNDPDVERIGEHAGQPRHGNCGAGPSAVWTREPFCGEFGLHFRQRVLAGGVKPERFFHQDRPLRIEDDSLYLLAVSSLDVVQVPDGGFSRPVGSTVEQLEEVAVDLPDCGLRVVWAIAIAAPNDEHFHLLVDKKPAHVEIKGAEIIIEFAK